MVFIFFQILIDLIIISFLHWVGDFVFQTREMATNKSHSIKWLSYHVLTYTAIMFLGLSLFFNPLAVLSYVLINGFLHWLTDFFTSKLTAKYYKEQKQKQFFTTIGFDQHIHQTCLLTTYFLILSIKYIV